ncbi:hypothetical protein AXG93_813s1000 [Marchantia polymorpha subsp. ruderalis]|uniref:Uncharacterized protein n=1 Tax=Marchantia polymorpha subsp. ruderalis TaxID=1480154 RepID=A0A176W699_MARPO|nr:hypothetical protein AXG93_813s1000 [Marchantia polymorpha subsp. ruderalis]
MGRRSGEEPATRRCCSQTKAPTNRALQSAQAEGTQARLAGKQSGDGACCRGKKLAILGGGWSSTALDILAGSSAAAAAAEATQPNSRESSRNSVATEILNSENEEDESSSEEEKEESVQGTPTTALCEQMVHLLKYLDRKVAKYADPRHSRSYVELVRRQTHTKVRTRSLLASLDETIKDLKLKNEALCGHLALVRKLQKAVNKMRDEKLAEAEKKFAKQREKLEAELDSEQTQNLILSKELVRQTRLLEQCQSARQTDEDLIPQLQSQCGELRAQRAEAEL